MSEGKGKTLRWNFIVTWNTMVTKSSESENAKELVDRFMIALYRFQTEGRVAYRRICGMHGGGGGNSDLKFKEILQDKMNKDISTHYNGEFPDNYTWPNPVPNCPFPKKFDQKEAFAYTFCWHAEPQFIVWHRPLMIEFERGLQQYDPKEFANDNDRYYGPEALGVPYWAWETWDGLTLPYQFTISSYYVQSSKFKGWTEGTKFNNPLFRWFAPVSLEQQVIEYFPPSLTESNCSTRSQAFTDMNIPHDLPWPTRSEEGNPSMLEVVNHSMTEPDFMKFCTVKPGVGGGTWSIENPHNKFHNHIGGLYYGGIQGAGHSTNFDNFEFTGTMAQNQSIFDPIFWLHHSNIERQLVSWQNIWYPAKGKMPTQDVLDTVLYPWTKPTELEKGHFSWNTPSSSDNDATFNDWWTAELPYEYDQYLVSLEPTLTHLHLLQSGKTVSFAPNFKENRTRLEAKLTKGIHGGEFTVYYTDESGKSSLVSTISILNAWGSGCARCAQKAQGFSIDFEVSHFIPDVKKFEEIKKGLSLKRLDKEIEVSDWSFSKF